MSLKNIQQTRNELRAWGYFWYRRKHYMGGRRMSLTALFIEKKRSETIKHKRKLKYTGKGECRQCMLKGVDVPYDVIGKESRTTRLMTSADINIPPFVQAIDNVIERLKKEYQLVLVAQYINNNEQVGFWIDEAEHEVMVML